jgi:hypothetical protein
VTTRSFSVIDPTTGTHQGVARSRVLHFAATIRKLDAFAFEGCEWLVRISGVAKSNGTL